MYLDKYSRSELGVYVEKGIGVKGLVSNDQKTKSEQLWMLHGK